MENIIEVKNLTKFYKKNKAIDDLSFDVHKGEILGFLGPNGSGKSTTINCILSLLNFSKGSIKIFGKEMKPNAYDLKRKKYIEEAINLVGLKDFKKYYPKQLSGGLLRRLNIACGIAHKPEIIFLDEPTVAVDPQSRNSILDGIKKLRDNGATIIYTTHYMEEVEILCDRVIIIDAGKIIAQGTNDELKDLAKIKERITVEAKEISNTNIKQIKMLPEVQDVVYENDVLKISYENEKNNLETVIDFLKSNQIKYKKIYSERPTLNDVFLELTGKELRD